MLIPERTATIVVCSLATLMLAVLALYGCTFIAWNFSPAFLIRVNKVLGVMSWVVPATCMVVGVIIGIATHKFRWSLRAAPSWVQTLSAIAFVITLVLIVGTLMKQKKVEVRAQGQTVEISVNGNWESATPSVLEQTVQQNSRLNLVFVLFGLLLWMQFAAAVSAHNPNQSSVEMQGNPLTPPSGK